MVLSKCFKVGVFKLFQTIGLILNKSFDFGFLLLFGFCNLFRS